MQKNVTGQKWYVFAFDETDNTAKTGDAANITANLRIDGGVANAIDDTNPTELEDGYYVFDITQAESNGDYILICPASSTANIQVIGVPGAFTTTPPNYNAHSIDSNGRVDVIKVAGTAQTANDNGADINAILTDTDEIQGKLPTNKFMGSSDGADDDGTLNSILTDTAEIGTAGAGLTDLGGMSTSMKAEVQSECDDALVANNLDHLCKTATSGADMTTEVADNTIVSRILSNGDTSAFVPSTDGLQLIRDKQTDIETDTAEIGTAGAGLTDLGGMSTTMKGEVNAEVDTALNTAIPGSPTANSINERVKAIDDKLPSSSYLKGSADSDGGVDTNDKADIQAECNDALVALNLDHLMKTAVANNADMTTEVADGTVLSNIMSKTSDTSSYAVATDSQEGIADAASGDVTKIKGTALTETNAGDLAENFSQFFDVDPTTTKDVDDVGSVASGGVPRIE